MLFISKHFKDSVLPKFRTKSYCEFSRSLSNAAERNDYGLLACTLAQIGNMTRTSSGMTTLLLSAFGRITRRGHCCALVDAGDYFDPIGAETAEVDLEHLLWVRCRRRSNKERQSLQNRQLSTANSTTPEGSVKQSDINQIIHSYAQQIAVPVNGSSDGQSSPSIRQVLRAGKEVSIASLQIVNGTGNHSNAHTYIHSERENDTKKRRFTPLEQAFKVTDILIQNGGFALIVTDLRNIEARKVRKVPLTTWFRFARVAEKTQTTLVFLTNLPTAQSCAGLTLHIGVDSTSWSDNRTLSSEEEHRVRPSFDEAVSKEVSCTMGHFSSKKRPLSWYPKETSHDEELLAARSKSCEDRKKKHIVSHTQTLKGAEYEIKNRRGRKPVQSSAPKFQAMSNWK